ncbi:MAG: GntR family transcriptional regulator [Pseudorhodoplanes sp.]
MSGSEGSGLVAIAAPSTKTDYVYRSIKAKILEGSLSPGARLRLSELAREFSISEMPVREALRMLQRDGLVFFESHRGATVAELSVRDVLDVIATRTHLEILAICEALPHYTPQSLTQLEDLLVQMRKSSPQKFSELNHAFHQTLYGPCPNEFLKREIDELWERVWRRWARSLFDMRPERRQGAQKEHEDIVRAIRSGVLADVENAVRRHRQSTIEAWQSLLNVRSREQESRAS